MPASQDHVRFKQLVLLDLNAAYNLARWLLRSLADAEDLTQEAMLRSSKFFSSSRWGDARLASPDRAQQCFPSMAKNSREENMSEFDEEFHGPAGPTPEGGCHC